MGPVGVWLGVLMGVPPDEERAALRRIEALGYGSVWTGEGVGGKEAFSHQAVMLAATERIVTGTGIATVWLRHPLAMLGAAHTLGVTFPGRFLLGIGISHGPLVEMTGQRYEQPLARMASYLDDMNAAAASSPGPPTPVPCLLAALGPQMLALARDEADGAHPYFVPPQHTALAREILGPGKLLVPEQAVVLHADRAEARRIARSHLPLYLGLPNYANNLRRLGFDDDDFADGGSERLADAIVAVGDEADIARRVTEHLDAGADHVLLQPLGDLAAALDQLERLAPAVLAR
jgi:probable F420-dependent oxidoreductase